MSVQFSVWFTMCAKARQPIQIHHRLGPVQHLFRGERENQIIPHPFHFIHNRIYVSLSLFLRECVYFFPLVVCSETAMSQYIYIYLYIESVYGCIEYNHKE